MIPDEEVVVLLETQSGMAYISISLPLSNDCIGG
ncbi:hypothetical protein Pan161_07420 [Gimesia algae]|uniref:Uncharacterized protein n=1 Tax=Gimesia algae TaxID=2527971 RepID=A0A517V7Y0_9PLAN|nr:hypothetical protein Pan161_07420 [Gimesia algae]